MRTITKSVVNPKKAELYKQIQEYSKDSDIILISSLHKVRSAQLLSLRKSLQGQVKFLVAPNRIASKSLLEGKIVNEDFAKTLTNQNVLMFSKIDPFKLYLTLTKNTVNLAARAGDNATDEIKISSGDTGIPAGPVLSDFREAGVATRIDSGNILVTEDSIVAKQGDVITTKLASLLSKLGLTPIKAGLSISKAYWNGTLLDGSEIRIDIDEYISEILKSSQSALVLAVDLQYITSETSSIIISKASNDALQLAIASGYLSEETIPSIISTANQEANSLKESVKSKGYE
mgnify:FL=1|tara:strand:- start:6794 stop:7660 length:867 start_codon:yes stop_codon:yes gene_type:complete